MGSTTFSSWIQLNPSCQQVLSLALAGILHKSGPQLRFMKPELVSRRQIVASHRRMKAVIPSLSRSAYTVDSDHDVFQGCVPLRYPAGHKFQKNKQSPSVLAAILNHDQVCAVYGLSRPIPPRSLHRTFPSSARGLLADCGR